MLELKNRYNRADFLLFLGDFLPEDHLAYDKPQDLPLERTKSITDAVVLSESKSLDIKVFEVGHAGSKEARVNLAREVFRIMADTLTNRALVVFKSPDSGQWRLSLMTIQLDYDESKNKIKKAYSNPRRYSYILGQEAKTVTPYKYLIGLGKVKDVEDLQKRFSIEVVNNEFYKEFAKLYDELVGTDKTSGKLKYPTSGDESHEFAVRLIGRIIFCWFLREKKSKAGISLIPTNVLSRSASDQASYYHNVLATLFFEVLYRPVEKRTQKFQTGDYKNIPYLNGGLFNNDMIDHYTFNKGLESSVPGLVDVPDSWLHDLFDLLERFNFTVDENTSYDTDLSIDPEMLGRVFENLLARINPETGETVRRSTGSFYTPREIVDYMVDISLVEYLETETNIDRGKIEALVSYDPFDDLENEIGKDEASSVLDALSTLTVLDPACGSGAFPIGMLQKVVFVISKLDPGATWWLAKQLEGASLELRKEFANRSVDYVRKLGVIRQSIFGVDIQPIATEISRLRCFLTLIVDEAVDDTQENRGIRPLPNLDFKFVTANSLIPLPKPEDKKGEVSEDQAAMFEETSHIDELKQIRNEYFTSTNHERNELQSQFDRLQKKMVLTNVDIFRGSGSKLYDALSRWEPFEHKPSTWFDTAWMFGIEQGFDIVIGNPPYYKENDDKRRFDNLRNLECYQGKMDVWYLFGALGIDILKSEGILCYIATNNWTTNAGASKFRNKVLKESKVLQLVDFGSYFVFESSSIQTMVMLFRKTREKHYEFDYRKINADKPVGQDMLDILVRNTSDRITYLGPTINVSERINSLLTFSDKDSEKILAKIISQSGDQLTEKEVAQGIVCPQDYVNKKSREKLGGGYNIGDGVFVLNQQERESLSLSPDEESLIKPYYTSKQLGRYRSNPTNEEWIIYTDSSFKNIRSMDSYPTLKSHLDQFREVITSDNHPYGLHRAREQRFFTGEKIMVLRKSTPRPVFTLTDFDCYVSAAFFVIKSERFNLKYLTGFLNSKLVTFWLKNKGKMQGNNYQIDKEPLLAIPIAHTTPDIQEQIADRVNDIYAGKGSLENLEAEIDRLVYRLYNLSPDEIQIIENSGDK